MRTFALAVVCACMALAIGPPATASPVAAATATNLDHATSPSIGTAADANATLIATVSPADFATDPATPRPALVYFADYVFVGHAPRATTFDPIDPGRSIA
jgi:hypothetical protein